VNKWAGKFARKIAISFPESASFFPAEKVAFTGNPIRKALLIPARDGAFEFLKLEPSLPIILIYAGSQGSSVLNDTILAALPRLVEKYQIVHQTGEANIQEIEGRSKVVLAATPYANRYRAFGYLNELAIRMSVGVAKIVIGRAGAGTIFEIAAWGLPSILIPIPEGVSHDQAKNAFAYARTGAATVIEQNNLTPGLLASEIDRILDNPQIARTMGNAARSFARVDASRTIAEALLSIALSHESE
jgi:UDP-N-acetylglucosamine--N-acetylmuramyl-(pentapeptide) pyrophosphoryl-undecaprenol N-acetylglucosamine transferase